VDGINASLGGESNILLNKMQSDAAVKKASGGAKGVGNMLQSFGDVLKDQMANVNNLQNDANKSMETYAVGGDIELHNVILAAEKADMALQLTMQIRNKAIGAYQEITRMSI
jgi:flagellar hook-basal body complex protein FliE